MSNSRTTSPIPTYLVNLLDINIIFIYTHHYALYIHIFHINSYYICIYYYILSLSIISLYDSCFDNHCMPSCLSSSVATVRSFGSTSGLSVGSSDCWGYLAFSTMTHHMGVSKNRVFPTKSSHFNRVFHYKL